MTDNRALVVRGNAELPDAQTWQTITQIGKALFDSGLLPTSIKTPQAATAVILKGRELGIPAMYALSNIVVINGKPTCSAELMLALIYRDQGDSALIITESTNERCTAIYTRRNWARDRDYSFTIEDAKRAGLLSNQTWQKYPAAMLRARCISAVARMAFADSIGGMYTPEELGARVIVTQDGEVVIDEQTTTTPTKATTEEPTTDGEFRDVPDDPEISWDDQVITEQRVSELAALISGHKFNTQGALRKISENTGRPVARLSDLTNNQAARLERGFRDWAAKLGIALEPDAPPFDPDEDAELMPGEDVLP